MGPTPYIAARVAGGRSLRRMSAAGYSGTPLPKKLGVKDGSRVLLLGAPEGFALDGVDAGRSARGTADVIVSFHTERREFERRLPKLRALMDPAAGLWIAWPKKASKLETDLDFAAVQETGLAAGLVDNKSASIDDDWQALRFVYRLSDR
jgi:hypothetical protein